MNIRQINEEYSVSGQITVDEVDEVKALESAYRPHPVLGHT